MVSQKLAYELGKEHNKRRPTSSSSYSTSINTRSATISLKTDRWLGTESPSCILSVNSFNFICILLVRSLDMQIDSSLSQSSAACFSCSTSCKISLDKWSWIRDRALRSLRFSSVVHSSFFFFPKPSSASSRSWDYAGTARILTCHSGNLVL